MKSIWLCLLFGVLTGLAVIRCAAQVQPPTEHIELRMPGPGFYPNDNYEQLYRFENFTVTVHGRRPISITIADKRRGESRSVELPSLLSQVTSVRLFEGRFAVLAGMFSGNASEVVVIDVSEAQVTDSFLCYSPSISPDGRYVAFVKYFPGHGIESADDHYMLYDVSLSPTENRPMGVEPKDAIVVGAAVYPEGIGNRRGDNIDVGASGSHNMASELFYWNVESNAFVFADRFKDEYQAILIRLGTSPRIDVLAVPIAARAMCLLPADVCFEMLSDVTFPKVESEPILLTFRGVNGTPAASHRFMFYPQSRNIVANGQSSAASSN